MKGPHTIDDRRGVRFVYWAYDPRTKDDLSPTTDNSKAWHSLVAAMRGGVACGSGDDWDYVNVEDWRGHQLARFDKSQRNMLVCVQHILEIVYQQGKSDRSRELRALLEAKGDTV